MRRLVVGLLAGLALLACPGVAHAECTTPELPVVGCPVPAAEPTPSPTPTPTAAPAAAPLVPSADEDRLEPEPVAAPVLASAPLPVLAAAPAADAPLPDAPAPAVVAAPAPVTPLAVVPVAAPAAAPTSSLTGQVAVAFAATAFGLVALPLLLGFLAGLRSPGGTVTARRTRLWTGLGVLALAAVVAGIGAYRIGGEPLLNRQIPLLASAGLVVVLLSALGGALIVAEQLRGDQQRIGELEDAVRTLTEALAPQIEQPARGRSVDLVSQ